MPDAPEALCPSECDDDCDTGCHEHHAVPWKRHHDPATCPGNNVPPPEPPMPETDTTPEQIRAPWTNEQVANLNRFQREGRMHPFTCGGDHHGPAPVLTAHHDGWHCPQAYCSYRQNWAHAFMADPDTWPKPIPRGVTTHIIGTDPLQNCSCGGQGITHLSAEHHEPVGPIAVDPFAGRACPMCGDYVTGPCPVCAPLAIAALARIRELHQASSERRPLDLSLTPTTHCTSCDQPWPCPTIRALDAPPNGDQP